MQKQDLVSMVKAVQATLLHCNSTDEHLCYHLCPEGVECWCKWQVAMATEKYVHGYTQNANECLHSTLWRYCPKELFFGLVSIDLACVLAVCCFNDRASSLTAIANQLGVQSTPLAKCHLRKDYMRLGRSKYGKIQEAKKRKRAVRKKERDLTTRLTLQKVARCCVRCRSIQCW